ALSLLPCQFSLSPLSLLPRDLGRATLRLSSDGPATTGRADLRRGTIGSTSVSPSQPDQPPPRAALSWPENCIFRRRFFRSYPNSSSKFSFVSPPNRSSKRFSDLLFMDNQASEVQPISRRNLQRVVEVHMIHHRATLSLCASKSGRN
ncbi:hypothetical protein Prudu_006280, partial [Prunus dulcis]